MKGLPTCLRPSGVAVTLITTILAGSGLLARSGQAPVPALPADAPLPPSTPAFSPAGVNFTGQIVNEQGAPIPGARVLIDAAKPRVGRGYT